MNIELQQSRQMEGENPQFDIFQSAFRESINIFEHTLKKKMHEKKSHYVSYVVEGKKILKIKEIDFPLLGTKARVKKNAKCQCF